MKTLILLGGIIEKDFARELYETEAFDYIIAADGGLLAADRIGILPTDIVGDFDTVSHELVEYYQAKNIPIREFQPEKDATDSQIAMELAIEYESDEIYVLGAIGTRIDHVLGNIQLLALPLRKEITCYILDKYNRIQLIREEKRLEKSEIFGTYISLLPFTEEVRNLTLEGFKYPLKNYNMDIKTNLTLGISNELIEEEGRILFSEGVLILIEARD